MQTLLTTQLLLATQDLLTRFFNVNEEINRKLIKLQRLSSILDILALSLLGILLLSNVVFLQRSVVKPVLKLHEGAEIIGAGNLDYKVGTATGDEIGELSQGFDRMTANLRKVTVSRDELVREMGERQRAEVTLRESEARFRSLFENMAEGVALHEMIYDAGGRAVDYRILSVNPAFEKHTGLKVAHLQGQLASRAYARMRPPIWKFTPRWQRQGKLLLLRPFSRRCNATFTFPSLLRSRVTLSPFSKTSPSASRWKRPCSCALPSCPGPWQIWRRKTPRWSGSRI